MKGRDYMERRDFLSSMALTAATAVAQTLPAQAQAASKRTTHLKQSVNAFCFGGQVCPTGDGVPIGMLKIQFANNRTLEDTIRIAKEIGFQGYDMLRPDQWPLAKKHGIIPSMYPFGTIGSPDKGINRKEIHDELVKITTSVLKECGANGVPTTIAMIGMRSADLNDQQGADNTVEFLNRVKAQAEDSGVTICMELLNSKVQSPAEGHVGYMFDRTQWGIEVCKRVNSPRVKILYDIYHAQVDEGDVVRTMRDNIQWIGHIHTAGNPGRHQLDDNQELNWRFIARAIADLNYTGFVGHEYFVSEGADPIACLKQAFEIFNI
jgi:hydroxypyruvate isomerase